MNLTVTLSAKESEEFFHNSLCNMYGIAGYDLTLDYNVEDYTKAKTNLENKLEEGKIKREFGICREDVWLEILKIGKKLKVIDGAATKYDKGYSREIELKDVHERVQKTPAKHLIDMSNETDDAITADAIFQTVFFGEILFG